MGPIATDPFGYTIFSVFARLIDGAMNPGALVDARTVVLIAVGLLSLLSVLFAAIWRQASGGRQAGLWALGYALMAVGLLLANLSTVLPPPLSAGLAFTFVLTAAVALAWGVFIEVRLRFPWRTLVAILGSILVAQIYFLLIDPDIQLRVFLVSLAFSVADAFGIAALLRERRTYRRWPSLFTVGWIGIGGLTHAMRAVEALLASPSDFSGPIDAPNFSFGAQLAFSLAAAMGVAVGLLWLRMAEWHQLIKTEVEERRRSEAALAEAKDEAEKAGQAKSRFLASISHDIRTPMNAIVGLSRLLSRTPLDRRQRSHVDRIGMAANTLLQLIEGVLDASRLEAGKMTVEASDFNLADVLMRVDVVAGVQAEAKGIVLSMVPASDVPMALRGDPVRLGQILLNIVGNAVKFTESGEVTMSVAMVARRAATADRPATAVLRFIVHDTGPGIAAQDLPHIFEPFRQGGDHQQMRAGSGLGLAIAAQLVRMMGGSIRVESVLGLGSTFTVDLPLQYAVGIPLRAEPLEAVRLEGARILVVDDDETNREVASEILAEAGAVVELASDGLAAVERALAGGLDAILMDVSLPQIDGVAAAERIRIAYSADRLPIVAVTAHAFDEERTRCLAAGMNEFVTKPVEPAQLLAVLGRCLPLRAVSAAVNGGLGAGAGLGAATLPHIPGFDISGTVGRFCGNVSVVERLLGRFSQRCSETAKAIETALGEGRVEEARALAHGFKGAAATLGAKGLSELAGRLEHALKVDDRDEIAGTMTTLTEQMDLTANALAEHGF